MNCKKLVFPALAGLLTPTLAACGSSDGADGGNAPIVVGTTDQITASKNAPAPLDPAQAYELGQWNVMRGAFQTLVRLPRSGTTPVPDAATSCHFTDTRSEQYRCTLRSGLRFSNGDRLTAADVKYSIARTERIHFKDGPFSLLDNIDKVETPHSTQVVFQLKKPDATFPLKLATPAAAIVDPRVYPAASLHKGFDVVGSGPYTVKVRTSGDRATDATFSRNPRYKGSLKPKNSSVRMRFLDDSKAMESALRKGDIDLMNRTLEPGQVKGLQDSENQHIVLQESPGEEIRFLTFNTTQGPTARKAVRQAMSQVIDRSALVGDVYSYTGEPLYSLVPSGINGHTNAFFAKYGNPNAQAARAILRRAHITSPVALTMNYSTHHYGTSTAAEFKELKKQLDASGLFKVKIHGVDDFNAYRDAAGKGKYQVWGMGWFPDFPDADNYVAPFVGPDNSLGSPYRDSRIESQLLPATQQNADRNSAGQDFQRMQKTLADDVPYLPLWQGKQYVAARDDITGVEWAVNSGSALQIWELGRGVSGS